MKSKGVVAASIRSSRGPAGGGSCALLVANTKYLQAVPEKRFAMFLQCLCGSAYARIQ